MKKYLLVCFLALGTILPTSELKSSTVAQSRVITVTLEGYQLLANSDAASGPILQIQVYHVMSGERVRLQGCESYSCSVNLEGLPMGNYIAYVIAQNGTCSKKFKL